VAGLARNKTVSIGTVKFYNSEKGYGFIVADEGDIFFHISDFDQAAHGEPLKGLAVQFTLGESEDRKTGSTRTRAKEISPTDEQSVGNE
jgi:CspA family cold shock protein